MAELNMVLDYIRKNPNKSDMREIKRGKRKNFFFIKKNFKFKKFFFYFLAINETKKVKQYFYSAPIETPLNTKMFEEEPTHYNYQLTTQPSPPRPLPLPPTPLPLPPTPPVLPILSPLPISPQILHNVETNTQVLHNVETDTESSTQQDQQDLNIQNIQEFTQILHNEKEQDRQDQQEQLQNLFLHYPNIETFLPNLTETEQFNPEQNYQFYPEQNYSIQTGIQPPNVEVNETEQEIMETISYVVNSQETDFSYIPRKETKHRTGKDISLLKKHHEEEKK